MGAPLRDLPPLILIAEDDPDVLDVLELLLGDAGYRIVTAVDGLAALEAERRDAPDLILINDGMPHLDGAGFCEAYRDGGGMAPVVLISAASPEALTATAERCGAVAAIAKPFDVDEVLAIIARHLPTCNVPPSRTPR
jgi:DNA-binding response OmpR family regulator